ncbi:hypothetical protein [Kordia sp.]|nr:hypothetical protein [Kordia sp.]MCH2196146.1 hypothetical protein [Kordia sp.]
MIDGVNTSPTGLSNKMISDVAKEWILKIMVKLKITMQHKHQFHNSTN